MNTLPCRVFPHERADGPANMARDEALLDLVAEEPDAAAFRTYGWTEATLSLGYFQSVGEAESNPRWRGVPIVRRPTGGGAIWHDRELTYALAVPCGHPLSRRGVALYQAVHEAIAGVLRGLGVEAHRRGGGLTRREPVPRPFLCFTDRDAEDIIVGRDKVVGSAQRRRSGAVLQHGSILLARSDRTPELPGVSELRSRPVDAADWPELLRGAIPAAIGCLARAEGWPVALLARAGELERFVFREPTWTRRR